MLAHDQPRQLSQRRIVRVQHHQLALQAFAQVARRHARRVKLLHDEQRRFQLLRGGPVGLGNLFQRRRQVAIFIQVPDNRFRQLLHAVGAHRRAQLPRQMIGKVLRRREEFLERRALEIFAFAITVVTAAAGVQVLAEKRSYIELVEGIGRFRLRNLFRFFLDERFVRVIVRAQLFFGQLFEHGIGHHLLRDHLAQLQAVQRQHTDHLHQARREDLLLRHAQVQLRL